MGNTSPRFKRFPGQRQRREQSWEWARLSLVCLAIAILWGWQLGQGPFMALEELPVDLAQQWLEQWEATGFNLSESWGLLGNSPLTVVLIALGQSLGREGLWGDRLPLGMLNLLSLPLLYGMAKTLTGKSLTALLTVVVYGTTVGVTYWARLATPNGLLLPLTLLYLTSVLFCRRDLRGSLTLGLSLTALALTHWQTAVLLGTTGLIFLHWDTPRLLRTPSFWMGLGLGLLPAIAWWGYYSGHGGGGNHLVALGNGNRYRGWLWILASAPGLIFAVTGFQQAQQSQLWSWARFLLCHGGVYSLLVILAPWSSGPLVMPLFAPLSLAAAISFINAYHPTRWDYPHWWAPVFLGGAGLTFVLITGVYWQGAIAGHAAGGQFWGVLLLALLAMTLMMTATLLDQQKSEFIAVLFWGLWVCLYLLLHSPLWSTFLDWTNQWYSPLGSEALILTHHHFGP
ncbi:MAG: glycosyltransferase family 39 protein [Synechocystis sp.]